MKKLILLLFIPFVSFAQTPITDDNFLYAINTCYALNPYDGMCSDSEFGAMPDWDVSQVTNMDFAFADRDLFNGDISEWDVSNVTTMLAMFEFAYSFNQPIGNWDVSGVTDMRFMFSYADSFNQPIGGWDVSSVILMDAMFDMAYGFNQDISNWCVTNITSEPSLFSEYSNLSESYLPVWGTCPSFGLDDQNQSDISIHPNPSSQFINITIGTEMKAVVFDLLGKELIRENINSRLDISSLEKGTYILNLTDGINSSTHKIIKE